VLADFAVCVNCFGPDVDDTVDEMVLSSVVDRCLIGV
jgi:hypothetical protein